MKDLQEVGTILHAMNSSTEMNALCYLALPQGVVITFSRNGRLHRNPYLPCLTVVPIKALILKETPSFASNWKRFTGRFPKTPNVSSPIHKLLFLQRKVPTKTKNPSSVEWLPETHPPWVLIWLFQINSTGYPPDLPIARSWIRQPG